MNLRDSLQLDVSTIWYGIRSKQSAVRWWRDYDASCWDLEERLDTAMPGITSLQRRVAYAALACEDRVDARKLLTKVTQCRWREALPVLQALYKATPCKLP